MIILTLGFLSSCKVPGVAIDPLQISQTQQSTNLEDIKRGVVIFRGISCPKGIEDNIEEESFITNLLKRTKMFFSSKCRGYKFVNDQYPNYYIRQFSDTASHKTFSNSKYYFYTVVPGKYYYEFSQNHDLSDKEMKKAFY